MKKNINLVQCVQKCIQCTNWIWTFFTTKTLENLFVPLILPKEAENSITSSLPDLDSRVHVIVDIIIFQYTMSIVIKIHPNLFRKKKNKTTTTLLTDESEG